MSFHVMSLSLYVLIRCPFTWCPYLNMFWNDVHSHDGTFNVTIPKYMHINNVMVQQDREAYLHVILQLCNVLLHSCLHGICTLIPLSSQLWLPHTVSVLPVTIYPTSHHLWPLRYHLPYFTPFVPSPLPFTLLHTICVLSVTIYYLPYFTPFVPSLLPFTLLHTICGPLHYH